MERAKGVPLACAPLESLDGLSLRRIITRLRRPYPANQVCFFVFDFMCVSVCVQNPCAYVYTMSILCAVFGTVVRAIER